MNIHLQYMVRSVITVALIFPSVVFANIEITEIAWMGTSDDANNEWIELRNTENGAVDVTGWTVSDGGGLSVVLGGVISANDYVVLERTDDDTLPSITAFQIYTGALPNTGRTLTLRDTGGAVQDTVVGGTDWSSIGGNNDTKETPQRTTSGVWVTALPTPSGATVETASAVSTPTPSGASSQSVSVSSVSTQKSGGGGGSLKKLKPTYSGVLTLRIKSPETVYVNQPVTFEVVPDGLGPTMLASLTHQWNFGDTYTGTGKKVTHTFQYPGTYTVVVESTYAKHTAMLKQTIEVVPHTVVMRQLPSGDVEIQNQSPWEIHLEGYELQGTASFVFPRHSYMGAGDTMVVPHTRFGKDSRAVTLLDPMEGVVAYASLYTEMSSRTPMRATNVASLASPVVKSRDVSTLQPSAPPTPVTSIGSRESEVIQIGAQVKEEAETEPTLARWWSRIRGIFE